MFPRIAIVVLLLLAMWGGLAHASGASGHSRAYTVKSGDTLWSIAQRNYSGDPRRGVWDLEQRNDLGRSVLLTPGQRLVVPL